MRQDPLNTNLLAVYVSSLTVIIKNMPSGMAEFNGHQYEISDIPSELVLRCQEGQATLGLSQDTYHYLREIEANSFEINSIKSQLGISYELIKSTEVDESDNFKKISWSKPGKLKGIKKHRSRGKFRVLYNKKIVGRGTLTVDKITKTPDGRCYGVSSGAEGQKVVDYANLDGFLDALAVEILTDRIH